MKATVNINEAAKILKVSRRTIYYWISKGYLSALDGPGRGWRIPSADLEGMEKNGKPLQRKRDVCMDDAKPCEVHDPKAGTV